MLLVDLIHDLKTETRASRPVNLETAASLAGPSEVWILVQTEDLWLQGNQDSLEKGTTIGPVVPKQETMLLSQISAIVVVVRIIGKELAVLLHNKFKAIITEISPKLIWSK
jgi:hypothetical protein